MTAITTTGSPLSPLRAVSYVRVSTLDQVRRGTEPERLSIPAQREANRRRALEMGALIVADLVERGPSGRSIERPELQRMLEYIQDRPVDFVIVHKIDRLARSRADDAAITRTIQNTGAYLVSATEAISTTPSGSCRMGSWLDRRVLLPEPRHRGDEGNATEGLSRRNARAGTARLSQRASVHGWPRGPRHHDRPGTGRAHHLGFPLLRHRRVERHPPRRRARDPRADDQTWTEHPRPLTVNGLHRLLRRPYYKGVVVHNDIEHPGRHEPET